MMYLIYSCQEYTNQYTFLTKRNDLSTAIDFANSFKTPGVWLDVRCTENNHVVYRITDQIYVERFNILFPISFLSDFKPKISKEQLRSLITG